MDRSQLPYSEHLGPVQQEAAQPNIAKKAHHKLQKNLEENENNDENVTNEQVHHNDVQLEENENNNDMLNYIPSNIYDPRDVRRTWIQKFN